MIGVIAISGYLEMGGEKQCFNFFGYSYNKDQELSTIVCLL